jgi:hypothetical protein
MNQSGMLHKWDSTSPQPTLLFTYSKDQENTSKTKGLTAFSPQGTYAIFSHSNRPTLSYHIPSNQTKTIVHDLGDVTTLDVKENGTVFLGGVNGELWVWRPTLDQALKLGHQYGELSQTISSIEGDLLVSRSDRQMLVWQGPFQHQYLKKQLKQVSPLCMPIQERRALLNESSDEAQFAYQLCLKQRKSLIH